MDGHLVIWFILTVIATFLLGMGFGKLELWDDRKRILKRVAPAIEERLNQVSEEIRDLREHIGDLTLMVDSLNPPKIPSHKTDDSETP